MTPPPHWRKSSHSGGDEGECVEIADLNDHIAIRDSKNPAAGHLTITHQHFATLLNHLAGSHDHHTPLAQKHPQRRQ